MIPAIGVNNIADLSNFQLERHIFKSFLHLSPVEEPQISASLATGALRVRSGDLPEQRRFILELLLEVFDVGDGFFASAGDGFVAEGVEGSAGFFVFLEDMCAVD